LQQLTKENAVVLLRNRKRWGIMGGVALLLLGLGVAYWWLRPDPALAHLRALRDQLAEASLGGDQRRELWGQFRQEVRQLSPDQRGQLFADRGQRFKERLAQYSKLPKNERVAFLNQEIDRMEAARKEWEKNRPPDAQAGAARARDNRFRGDEEREQRRRAFLDRTTPEERVQLAEFRKDMNQLRQQRGLPPWRLGR
jgi:hypothetical protein